MNPDSFLTGRFLQDANTVLGLACKASTITITAPNVMFETQGQDRHYQIMLKGRLRELSDGSRESRECRSLFVLCPLKDGYPASRTGGSSRERYSQSSEQCPIRQLVSNF